MLLSIISINYKKPELTIRCLDSVYANLKNAFIENTIEYIIVDNYSEDASGKQITNHIRQEKYKNVHFVQNSENTGYGAGNNLGADSAKGSLLLFLNNDTQITDTDLLDMAKYMQEHDETAICGGILQNPDGSIQPSIGRFYTPLGITMFLLGLQRLGLIDTNPNKITKVQWVKGALFMIRSEVFKKLGGFDENIFMYTEDMELCYRAQLTGYKTYFYPGTPVIHEEQGSSSRSFAIMYIYQNLLYFYKKHRPEKEYAYVKSLLQIKARILIFIGSLTGNKYLSQTYEKALAVVR